MYPSLLLIHSWLRWVVLIAGVIAVFAAIGRALRPSDAAAPRDRASLVFLISVDLQFLLGILLMLVGPWMRTLASDPGFAMKHAVTRYWTVEHGFGMIIAVILVHVGRVVARKAATPQASAKRLAIFFVIALLIMLITIPWPFMTYARPLFRT